MNALLETFFMYEVTVCNLGFIPYNRNPLFLRIVAYVFSEPHLCLCHYAHRQVPLPSSTSDAVLEEHDR